MPPHLEAQRQQITNRIVEAFNPHQVILFGSHVYGRPTSDSDVDLLIIMDSDERPAARAARVSRLLRPRPFPTDIIVRTPAEIQHRLDIGDHFTPEILEQGQALYAPHLPNPDPFPELRLPGRGSGDLRG